MRHMCHTFLLAFSCCNKNEEKNVYIYVMRLECEK